MEIGVVGINHKSAPIEIREKFNFSESDRIEASSILQEKINEVIILSTCNRSEIYYACTCDDADSIIVNFYREYFNTPNVEDYIFIKKGEECASHLFKVAGGLDSIVIGEDQILNQLKDALHLALDLKFSRKVLNRLFMSAQSTGKKIRSKARISSIPLSTSYIGVSMLRDIMGTFKDKNILIVGAGEISELALKYLYDSEASEIYISNRSDGKLEEIFKNYPKLKKLEYKDRYKKLSEIDVLISATAAPHTVFTLDNMPKLEHDLYILDLALPRDIESDIKNLDNIHLLDLDDLSFISKENEKKRFDRVDKAMEIVEEEKANFFKWYDVLDVDPYIGSLHQKTEEIKSDSLKFINRKLDLDSREEKLIEKMLSYALNRLTHETIETLKAKEYENESEEYKEVIADIFNLGV